MKNIIRIARNFRARDVSIWNTIYFNFKVLPFKNAIKFPFILGRYMQFENLNQLEVRFEKKVHFAMISLGLKHWPISATKYNYSMIKCGTNAHWKIGDNIIINPGFTINIYKNATLNLGSNIYINQNTNIYIKNIVYICDGAHIGWNCQIYDNSFHLIYSEENKKIKSPYGSVYIGERTWIANGCTISGTVYIPKQSIVAALSLVNKDFSNVETTGNLFAGCPATLKKTGLYRVFSHSIQQEMFKSFFSDPSTKEITNENYTIEDLQQIDSYNAYY